MANFNIDLDLAKQPRVAQAIRVKKGDFGSGKIIADVYHNGAPFDMSGLDARFECRRKDGTKIVDGSASIEGNTITYTLPIELATHKELIKTAYFAILDGSVWRDTTEVFFIDVQESAVEGIVPGDYIPEIDAKIALLNAYLSIAGESEAQRVYNEDERVTAEAERVSNEATRVMSESGRIEAESSRITAESARSSTEAERVASETARVTAEEGRVSSEAERAAAEVIRIQSELYREATFAEMIASWQGMTTRILVDGEYDENGKPTIQGAPSILYLAPKDSAHSEDGYYEWIYISDGWERIGSTDTTITAITTDQIDVITGGESVLGDEILSTTGLTYLWSKISAIFVRMTTFATRAKAGIVKPQEPFNIASDGAMTMTGGVWCGRVEDAPDWATLVIEADASGNPTGNLYSRNGE